MRSLAFVFRVVSSVAFEVLSAPRYCNFKLDEIAVYQSVVGIIVCGLTGVVSAIFGHTQMIKQI